MAFKAWGLFFVGAFLVFCIDSWSEAHSGGTDSNGGHYNRKTGEYHYHGGSGTVGSRRSTSSSSSSSNVTSSATKKSSEPPAALCLHGSDTGSVAFKGNVKSQWGEDWYMLKVVPADDELKLQFQHEIGSVSHVSPIFDISLEEVAEFRDKLTELLDERGYVEEE